ncbi:hypothetical protein IPA_09405 [Ignicoccus pacificus DSM 13166]|uniref:ASCH domain-containing protein n=1 Tax=Ignicoccus pacificus DSM 13166 TaxID=940294 RepID=A0A977KA73_9CREN|nr:hypothetical protein IPA_09405 [Ignicoccus pacificus DSM 13166]
MEGRNKFLGRHIMIKGKYVDMILEGRKTTTIRLGKWIPKFDEVTFHGGGRPFAIARIVNVRYKRVSELTDEDARKDGLKNKEDLIKELKRVYENLRPDDYVTIIEFDVIKKLTELDVKDPYMGLKPVEIARLALRYLDLNPNERKILRTLTQTGSLREAAIRLYGSVEARWRVRKVLKRALHELVRKGIIGPRS